jgi:Lectin C-type domain
LRARFAAFLLGAFTAAGLAVALVGACLPDLPPPTPATCGDGVVNFDAGEMCDPGDASTPGCSARCQLECEGGVIDDASSHCYFWTPAVVSLALATCGPNAHVVSFVDDSELQFVAVASKTLPNEASGSSWVALERELMNDAGLFTYEYPFPSPQLPGWAASCIGCFGYTDASDFQLPGSGTEQPCVNWKHTLTSPWAQTGCTLGINDAGNPTTTSVLCEREPPGSFSWSCPDDAGQHTCIQVPVTRKSVAPYPYAKRYEVTGAENFGNARDICQARGGKLVEFQTSAEREEVVAELGSSGDYWIGLFLDADSGQWEWVNGPPAPAAFPTPWADLEPNNDAGSAAAIHLDSQSYTTNLARATDPTQVLPYICEYPN